MSLFHCIMTCYQTIVSLYHCAIVWHDSLIVQWHDSLITHWHNGTKTQFFKLLDPPLHITVHQPNAHIYMSRRPRCNFNKVADMLFSCIKNYKYIHTVYIQGFFFILCRNARQYKRDNCRLLLQSYFSELSFLNHVFHKNSWLKDFK